MFHFSIKYCICAKNSFRRTAFQNHLLQQCKFPRSGNTGVCGWIQVIWLDKLLEKGGNWFKPIATKCRASWCWWWNRNLIAAFQGFVLGYHRLGPKLLHCPFRSNYKTIRSGVPYIGTIIVVGVYKWFFSNCLSVWICIICCWYIIIISKVHPINLPISLKIK